MNMKEFSDKDLYELRMKSYSFLYEYDYLGGRGSLEWLYDGDNFFCVGEQEVFTLEDLKNEFSLRKLEEPLFVIPAPKTVIFLPIEVKSTSSKIIVPDTVISNDMGKYYDHPFQGVIVAMDKSIEWDALYVGCQIYLKTPQAEIFRFNGISYRYINYSSIIAIN